jgi:hypothetical protein
LSSTARKAWTASPLVDEGFAGRIPDHSSRTFLWAFSFCDHGTVPTVRDFDVPGGSDSSFLSGFDAARTSA